MYFILSKILLFVLFPFLWVCVLLLIALFTKDAWRKRRRLIFALVLLYFFSCPVIFDCVAGAWNVPSQPLNKKPYSCAIVLGGFTSFDKNGHGYFNAAADRFIQGVELFETGHITHIMITGGNGSLNNKGHFEGDWVRGQLKLLKFPDSCILIESRSRNTIENAVFSRPILQKSGLKPPYLLVTSDFHMRRAMMIFKKAGYDVIPYSNNPTAGHAEFTLDRLIPDAFTLSGWNIYFKEMIGYIVDSWKKY